MIAPSGRGLSAAALKWREPSGRRLRRSVRALGSRVADVEIKVAERGQATARALTHGRTQARMQPFTAADARARPHRHTPAASAHPISRPQVRGDPLGRSQQCRCWRKSHRAANALRRRRVRYLFRKSPSVDNTPHPHTWHTGYGMQATRAARTPGTNDMS
jgi:hypothetical protein